MPLSKEPANDPSRRKFLYQTALTSLGIICAGQSSWAKHSLEPLIENPTQRSKVYR
jgi:hypothetical protein